MTTTELRNFLITCDQNWQDDCHDTVTIRGVPNKYVAEEHAVALGWSIPLMASCPACEQWQANRYGHKSVKTWPTQ